MAGAILFGIYNHFIVISPDHVSHVSFTGWGLLFQIIAILTLIIDGIQLLDWRMGIENNLATRAGLVSS